MSNIHPLTEKIRQHSPIPKDGTWEWIDQQIRKWLGEKAKTLNYAIASNFSTFGSCEKILELEEEKVWCEHINKCGSGLSVTKEDFHQANVHEDWKWCPICGAKRP